MEKGKPSCIVGRNANWFSHSGGPIRRILKKKQNIQILYNLIIPPLGMYPQGIGINSKGQ